MLLSKTRWLPAAKQLGVRESSKDGFPHRRLEVCHDLTWLKVFAFLLDFCEERFVQADLSCRHDDCEKWNCFSVVVGEDVKHLQ